MLSGFDRTRSTELGATNTPLPIKNEISGRLITASDRFVTLLGAIPAPLPLLVSSIHPRLNSGDGRLAVLWAQRQARAGRSDRGERRAR
jgi:hypothetical protein